MDILYISVCLVAFLTCPSFAEWNFRFDNETQLDVTEGAESVSLLCHLDGASLFKAQQAEFVHVNPLTSEETIISKGATLEAGMDQFYEIKLEQTGEDIPPNKRLTIKKVRFEDDGKFLCRLTVDDKTGQAERDVVVHRPLTALKLKFGDLVYDKSPSDPVTIDGGKYEVSCIGEGSNPATKDLHLFLHGEHVDHGEHKAEAMGNGPGRQFSTSITGNVDITIKHTGQELECQAKDSLGNSLSTKIALKVNFYDPQVVCNDTEAYHGQDNPMLVCTVNHTGMAVESFRFQIGDSGDIIKEGEKNDKNIVLTVSHVKAGITIVALDLHKARHEYLNKNYYVLIDVKGGHTKKESVRLNEVKAPEIEDGNDGAGFISSSVSLMAMICVLLWSL